MVIEYPIPTGMMKINLEEFFLYGTKTMIRKMLKQYKESGARYEDFRKIWKWVEEQKAEVREDRLELLKRRNWFAEKLSRCTELYQKMKNPFYPEYTKDKKKLLEARNQRSAAKNDLNEVVREIAANEKQEKKWDLCRELIEEAIDSLQEVMNHVKGSYTEGCIAVIHRG